MRKLILQEGKQLSKRCYQNLQRNNQRSLGVISEPWDAMTARGLLEEEANQTAVCVMPCVPRSLIGCPKIDDVLVMTEHPSGSFIILLGDECSLFLLLRSLLENIIATHLIGVEAQKPVNNKTSTASSKGHFCLFFTVLDTHVDF